MTAFVCVAPAPWPSTQPAPPPTPPASTATPSKHATILPVIEFLRISALRPHIRARAIRRSANPEYRPRAARTTLSLDARAFDSFLVQALPNADSYRGHE